MGELHLHQEVASRLRARYDAGEAQAIARILLEDGLGISTAHEALLLRVADLSVEQRERLAHCIQQVLACVPVQYVVGKALFCGRYFEVSPSVLVPRPETCELVQLVLHSHHQSILDIGTGSGCIAVSLALSLPGTHVEAWDVSSSALAVAKRNAQNLGAEHITFRQCDVLTASAEGITPATTIVSNPPYILPSEREVMQPEVLEHEPHRALFVPQDDPQVFVRAIAALGAGHMYLEVNPLLSQEAACVCRAAGYGSVEVLPDDAGKPRFIVSHKANPSPTPL